MKGKKASIIKRSCKKCNNSFEYKDTIRNSKRKFCSRACAQSYNGENNKGKTRSLEFKNKMSQNFQGENNPFFKKKHSKKTIKKMSKSSMWDKSRFKTCNLQYEEKEVLDGLMLSDGCLSEKSRISARLTFGFKFKETCEEIVKTISSMNFSPFWQSEQTKCWHTKSNMYHDLLVENERWYPKGRKIVPKDVLITSTSCYWWFIGDGYNDDDNVYLCTESFSKNDNFFLIKKLKEKGYNPSLTSRNRIRFNKKESITFLHWIKPENGVLEQYKYKWKL